jgi:hypothetical protein
MSDATGLQPTANTALPEVLGHDGLASRVFVLSTAALVLPFLVATAAFWVGKLDAHAWVDLTQWLVTSVGATYGITNMGQRLAAALAVRGRQ